MTLRDLINVLAAADHLSRQASESDAIGRRLGPAEAGTLAAAHVMAACRQFEAAANNRRSAKTCPGADRIETACIALTGEYTADTLRKLAAMRAIENGQTLADVLSLDTSEAAEVLAGKQGDRGQPPESLTPDGWMSPKDLAIKHGLPCEALRKKLGRWRLQNGKGWMEVPASERGPRDAKFLYQPAAVKEVIDAMKE